MLGVSPVFLDELTFLAFVIVGQPSGHHKKLGPRERGV